MLYSLVLEEQTLIVVLNSIIHALIILENLHEVNSSDNGWPKFLRINPILNWSYSLIWEYIDRYNVDYCSLYREGYTSLGSKTRTRPNPKLLADKGSFLHARYLKDVAFERLGRF